MPSPIALHPECTTGPSCFQCHLRECRRYACLTKHREALILHLYRVSWLDRSRAPRLVNPHINLLNVELQRLTRRMYEFRRLPPEPRCEEVGSPHA